MDLKTSRILPPKIFENSHQKNAIDNLILF